MDSYIADLKAATEMELDLKIYRMNCLGIPQERIAKRLKALQKTISKHGWTELGDLAIFGILEKMLGEFGHCG